MERPSDMSQLTIRLARECEELAAASLLVSRLRDRVDATHTDISRTEGNRHSMLGQLDLLRGCVLPFCDASTLAAATRVNRFWHGAAKHDAVWQALAVARWPCLGTIPGLGNFRALYASRAQEGLPAPADVGEGEQYWILVEMPNAIPVRGAAQLSRAFELSTVVKDPHHQNIFEEAICGCPEGEGHDHSSGWLSLPIFTTIVVPPEVHVGGEDSLQFLELRVSVLRTSDSKTTQVFHGTKQCYH
jgi:hypothetical protein